MTKKTEVNLYSSTHSVNEYILRNHYTNKKNLCEKFKIDGFDYYVSDDNAIGKKYGLSKLNELVEIKVGYDATLYKGVIATNNFSIDLPQVIDRTEGLAKSYLDSRFNLDPSTIQTFERLHTETYTAGYNEHAESYPNSDEDMIKFGWFCANFVFSDENTEDKKPKELLEIWKSQQPKTIYYV